MRRKLTSIAIAAHKRALIEQEQQLCHHTHGVLEKGKLKKQAARFVGRVETPIYFWFAEKYVLPATKRVTMHEFVIGSGLSFDKVDIVKRRICRIVSSSRGVDGAFLISAAPLPKKRPSVHAGTLRALPHDINIP